MLCLLSALSNGQREPPRGMARSTQAALSLSIRLWLSPSSSLLYIIPLSTQLVGYRLPAAAHQSLSCMSISVLEGLSEEERTPYEEEMVGEELGKTRGIRHHRIQR